MPVTLTIRNIPITFPFEPYDVQKNYMEKVIECVENGSHGMLESPTGTGKTLSLLCSSLAWLTSKIEEINSLKNEEKKVADDVKDKPNNVAKDSLLEQDKKKEQRPQIIYSSRTHTQLTQAITELRRTHYAYVNTAVLGSRDQLCINPSISQETNPGAKVSKCRAAVKKKSCLYQTNVEHTKNEPIFHEEILDIEDLVRVGQKLSTCPYYLTRDLKSRADIIFMPYNYLLDLFTRKRMDVELKNCVVILDEGHNVEKMCEESASCELSWTDLTTCIEELDQIIEALPKIEEYATEPPPFTVSNLDYLRQVLCALRTSIDNVSLRSSDNSARFGGNFIFELLGKSQISPANLPFFNTLMSAINEWINTSDAAGLQHLGMGLEKVQHCLQVVFYNEKCSIQEHMKSVSESYKVYVTLESKSRFRPDSRYNRDDKPVKMDAKVVNFWCFNPAFGMRALLREGIRSIIITSGTLSPLEPLISELGIPMDVTLESGHVVTNEQFFVGVLQTGPDKYTLNSSFKTRSEPAYMQSLGRTIQNVARLIPHGLLVFFPSYAVMDKCLDAWASSGLWETINKTKEICVEPRNKRELKEVMNRYYAVNSQPGSKGACFFAVLRGKVSEGLDFIDHNGRGVIITGMPYPPWLDPRVVMKREYLNENKKRVTGEQWYQLEATRAVNQAIGRVIRHKNDYGVILFCDTRFSSPGIRKNLSCWLRNHVTILGGFPQLPRPLAVFFKNAKEKLPQPEIKPLVAECSDESDDDDISVMTSSSPSEYMEMRYTGRFAQRYSENYLRSKFAWRDKMRALRLASMLNRASRNRYESSTPRRPAVTYENTPTQPVVHPSSGNEPGKLSDCAGTCGKPCGSPVTTVSSPVEPLACHSGNTGGGKQTVWIAKPPPVVLPYSKNSRGVNHVPMTVVRPTRTYGRASTNTPATSVSSITVPTQEVSTQAVEGTSVYYGNQFCVPVPSGGQMLAENVTVAAPASLSDSLSVITDASANNIAVLPESTSLAVPDQTYTANNEETQYQYFLLQDGQAFPVNVLDGQCVVLDQNVQYVVEPPVEQEIIQID